MTQFRLIWRIAQIQTVTSACPSDGGLDASNRELDILISIIQVQSNLHYQRTKGHSFIHSSIHSGHFYSAPASPLPLRGAPDYSTDTVSEFHAEAHKNSLNSIR